jgi:hypothetical protein
LIEAKALSKAEFVKEREALVEFTLEFFLSGEKVLMKNVGNPDKSVADYTDIVNSIDEGIVATVGHGKPITAQPNDVYVPVLVNLRPRNVEDIVGLQGEPSQTE